MSRFHINRVLPLCSGLFLVMIAFVIDVNLDRGAPIAVWIGFVGPGFFLGATGLAARRPRLKQAVTKLSLSVFSSALTLAALEGVFRLAGFDFSRFAVFPEVPIYYRAPSFHAGEGVLRRPGPATWTGQVLRAYMRIHHSDDTAYVRETPAVVNYDSLGFRNPVDLKDWDVVVAGDSFVELGHLPYEDIFTTIAARRLGVRIKNLGVSATGPISQTYYVKAYGKAPSTRDAVLCFFEGNDVSDLDREAAQQHAFRTTGRPFLEPKQVSLIKAACDYFAHKNEAALWPIIPNALLVSVNPPRRMTVFGIPPSWDSLQALQKQNVAKALKNWGDTVRSLQMRPWLMYMPDSHRVFRGLIRYDNTNSNIARMPLGDFAPGLQSICTEAGILFINPYPQLRRYAESEGIPYNLIGDTHLSAEGSAIVAGVLADALKGAGAHSTSSISAPAPQ